MNFISENNKYHSSILLQIIQCSGDKNNPKRHESTQSTAVRSTETKEKQIFLSKMKFTGGTCENIDGELLDYEIIEHENNLMSECRLERRTVHIKKWIISTMIFTYLAALIDIHKTDSNLLILLSLILLTGVIIKAYLKVKRECVVIGDQIGLQLTTTYVIGRQTTIFISSNRMKDIFINEGFYSQRLIYYLTLLIDDHNDKSMLPLFVKLLPRLSLLKLFYRHLFDVLHQSK